MGGKEIRKDKHVKKSVVSRDIMPKEVLFAGILHYRKMHMIRNDKLHIYTIPINMPALSANDEKQVND